jgi:hypothetical protein
MLSRGALGGAAAAARVVRLRASVARPGARLLGGHGGGHGGHGSGARGPLVTPMVSDVLVDVTLIDFRGKRHNIKGLVGQSLTKAAEWNNLHAVLEDDSNYGSSDTPVQVVHNERWTEDKFGEGCNSHIPHVIVTNEWFDKLPKPLWDEEAQLQKLEDWAPGERTPHSRIASEIYLTKELSGLTVHVPDMYPHGESARGVVCVLVRVISNHFFPPCPPRSTDCPPDSCCRHPLTRK